MNASSFRFIDTKDALSLKFTGELTLYNLTSYQKQIERTSFSKEKKIILDLSELEFLDTAGALFLNHLQNHFHAKELSVEIQSQHQSVLAMLQLTQKQENKIVTIPKKKRGVWLKN